MSVFSALLIADLSSLLGTDAPVNWAQTVIAVLTQWSMRVLGALLILIGGWMVAAWASRSVARRLEASGRIDATIRPLIVKITRLSILGFTFVAVLNNFGVQTASIIAVLGAAGLAIGLALQGTLSNVAAGLVLLTLRPFRVGDSIEVGNVTGTALEIGLFAVRMKTFDGIMATLPNSMVWGTTIRNLTQSGARRYDIPIGIAYGADIDRAMQLALQEATQHPGVSQEPPPSVFVHGLGDSSVDLTIRAWSASDVWFATQNDLRRRIKMRFDAEDIPIPFPQREVRVLSSDAALPTTIS